MAQLTSIVLTDRKATPVAHTFLPRTIEGPVATLIESTGIPVGDSRFTISLGKPTAQGKYKPTLRLTIPVVQTQTLNGVSTPVVVRTAYAEASFSFDATSSEAERNDVVGMLADSLRASLALVHDTVVKLQGVY